MKKNRRSSPAAEFGLVADIGGTNCRFALVARGDTALVAPGAYPSAQFEDVYAAMEAYFAREAEGRAIGWVVMAVAGPIGADPVALTNRPWRISRAEIARRFGIEAVHLVNDFAALAASTPYLGAADLAPLGGGAPQAVGGITTAAVLGPGTGLGVGGLVRGPTSSLVLTTEGGHTEFAPIDDLEREIARVLARRFTRVSNERLLCGEGLANIYAALGAIEGGSEERLAPEQITRSAVARSDPRATRALEVFSRALGSFSGDVVLTLGGRGGLYVAGGMMTVIRDIFDQAGFRARFEAKGRLRPYMEATPAWIVAHPFPALVGAAALARDLLAAQPAVREHVRAGD